MHVFGIGLFGLIALFWVTYGLRVAYGATRLPWVRDFLPAPDANCPRISLLFAARDEEEKLPAALATLMEIDYPELEVVAVDDRSQDATGRIQLKPAIRDLRGTWELGLFNWRSARHTKRAEHTGGWQWKWSTT